MTYNENKYELQVGFTYVTALSNSKYITYLYNTIIYLNGGYFQNLYIQLYVQEDSNMDVSQIDMEIEINKTSYTCFQIFYAW